MPKFTDSLREALAKKQALHHPDAKNGTNKESKPAHPAPGPATKPMKKASGRGR